MTVTFRPIDRTLLEKQFQYFEYAAGCAYHLRDQLILKAMTCVAFASILSFPAKYRFMGTFMMFILAN
jgi:hypothetical protein